MIDSLGASLRHMCVDIGPRPSGSPENQAAAAYIHQAFVAAGYAVEDQTYACPAWQHEHTRLELDGQPVRACANAFSLPCDVSAPLVPICTLAELEAAHLSGKIGLLYGDLTNAPLAPKAWFLKSERDTRIVELLEQKAPVALITVQATTPGDLVGVIEDADFNLPSVTVPADVGLALLRTNSALRLQIKSRRAQGQACNVVARKAGEHPARIVLCAHYDTKFNTPGACDNASGVAMLLALAEKLGRQKLHYGLECTAFDNEEYLPIGDDEYMRRNGPSLDDVVMAINMDGVGQLMGGTSIAIYVSSPAFQAHVGEIVRRYPGVTWVDPWPESNHSTYSWRGVPCLAFSTTAGARIYHTQADTLERVNLAKLEETLALVQDVVASLQDKSPEWLRPSA
jgi:aminopeptidase YwaD